MKKLAKPGASKKWISIEVVSDFFSLFYSSHQINYEIYLPAGKKDAFTPEIIAWLDCSYDAITTYLFQKISVSQMIPYHIYVASLPETDYARFACKYNKLDNKFRPHGILALNSGKLEESEMMGRMVLREVLRSILLSYDPNYPQIRTPEQTPHYWLNQALISCTETLFTTVQNLVVPYPSDFQGNELKPFHGMHAGILQGDGSFIQNITNHGRGMSAFVQYLIKFVGFEIIEEIYNDISSGKAPVEAIRDLYSILDGWLSISYYKIEWYNFLNRYLQGSIYDVQGTLFYESIPEDHVFKINDENDAKKTFQGTYPDLSAQLFKIVLNDQSIKENGKLRFTVSGGSVDQADIGGELYGYANGQFTQLGTIDQVFDSNAFGNFGSLVFILCNLTANPPYTGNSSMELTIEAERRTALPFNYCQVELQVLGNYLIESNPVVTEPYYSTLSAFGTWYFNGSSDMNSFTGDLDNSFFMDSYHGKIHINFDDELNISSFNLTIYDRNMIADTLKWELSGSNLAKTYLSSSGASVQHNLTGTEVCSALQGLYNYSESKRVDGGINEYLLKSHSCDEYSLLKFGLNFR